MADSLKTFLAEMERAAAEDAEMLAQMIREDTGVEADKAKLRAEWHERMAEILSSDDHGSGIRQLKAAGITEDEIAAYLASDIVREHRRG